MKKQRLTELFALYMLKKASESEELELMHLLTDPELDLEKEKLAVEWVDQVPEIFGMSESRSKQVLKAILDQDKIEATPVKSIFSKTFWWAAAAVFLLIGSGAYYFIGKPTTSNNISINKAGSDEPQPGDFKAVLQLGDGSTVVLDSVQNGVIAKQHSASVLKDKGEITYNKLDEKPEIQFNTLSTPLGGQYKLRLSDGTEVWLNAGSSIRFPVAFIGPERRVEVSGEAYFEVAKNPLVPFVVQSGSNEIKVLGTHFNVNTYHDETGKQITLLEGSIKVSNETSNVLLHPGEQADIANNDKIQVKKGVDTDQIVAWKNGVFEFNQSDIQSIMRQISRWYDVEIVYEGKISTKTFNGIISRKSNIKDALKIMEGGGIHFKIDSKKIIVSS